MYEDYQILAWPVSLYEKLKGHIFYEFKRLCLEGKRKFSRYQLLNSSAPNKVGYVMNALPHACRIDGSEVIPNLLLVCTLSRFYPSFEVVSGSAVQFFFARSEGCITIFQKKLDLRCHPWFPVWVKADIVIGPSKNSPRQVSAIWIAIKVNKEDDWSSQVILKNILFWYTHSHIPWPTGP